jgi:hypothetical protein
MSPFDYHRPDTVGEAVALLETYGGDGKVLAGGQSLLPILASCHLTRYASARLNTPTTVARSLCNAIVVSGPGLVRMGAMVKGSGLQPTGNVMLNPDSVGNNHPPCSIFSPRRLGGSDRAAVNANGLLVPGRVCTCAHGVFARGFPASACRDRSAWGRTGSTHAYAQWYGRDQSSD